MSQLTYLRSGFLLRWVALIIDVVLVGVALGILLRLTESPTVDEAAARDPLGTGRALLIGVAFGGYWAIAEGSRHGRTVGKLVTQLRVVAVDGSSLGRARAALRAIVRAGPLALAFALSGSTIPAWPVWAVLLADHLWTLVDPARRTLHDRVAGSVVVDAIGTSEIRMLARDEADEHPLWRAAWEPPKGRRWPWR